MLTPDAIERRELREQRIIDAIDMAEHDVAAAIGPLVDKLYDMGVIRIHREWSASQELKLIREAAAKAALRSVLQCDWVGDLPREVFALWPEYAQ